MDRGMRRLIAFPCEGETLLGSLDEAPGTVGLLIVSGGNETRTGAARGMAQLARTVAAAGHSVFRFDRRGVGDSSGANRGYRSSASDIAAAAAAFRREAPGLKRIVGFGNCDGASALALFGRSAGIDQLVLANPWVVERPNDLPPPAAIRAHYRQRLRDPREWWRLLRGGVDWRKLAGGVRAIARPVDRSLADEVFQALATWGSAAEVVLASGDATAIAYDDATRRAGVGVATSRIETPSHSFAHEDDAAALTAVVLHALGKRTHTRSG